MNIVHLPRYDAPYCWKCGRALHEGRFTFYWDKEEDNERREIQLECPERNAATCHARAWEIAREANVAFLKQTIRSRLSRPRAALPLP